MAEVGLLTLFVVHVLYAYWLVMENRASRGKEGYEIGYRSKQRTTFLNLAPRSWMAISGTVVLGFLIWHLIDMRFGLRDAVDPTFGEYVDDGLEDESGRPLLLAIRTDDPDPDHADFVRAVHGRLAAARLSPGPRGE